MIEDFNTNGFYKFKLKKNSVVHEIAELIKNNLDKLECAGNEDYWINLKSLQDQINNMNARNRLVHETQDFLQSPNPILF